MNSADIRQSFLDYFSSHDHPVVASAPLVPHGDATLLFTNAGMVQFKNAFLGLETPAAPRATSVQRCLRVSGKHNDLENVGPSPRHHTLFEMLGNFSFGDYFKERAIELAWPLVTEVWGLPEERLFATVFEEDDEARDLWLKISSLPPERVLKRGAKDNFWSMGETGPCGPCSEIFIDIHPELPPVDFEEGDASGRYLEIWNLVFMQFDRQKSGEKLALPNPSVDTGAGLERVAAVLQGVHSNYDTDLFQPLIRAAAALAEVEYGRREEPSVSLRVIADHLRAVTFLLSDGVIPGNEGRGYVLRRILRRALRHGMRLGFEEPFLHRLVPVVGEVLGKAYPEILATEKASVAAVEAEESKFLSTVASGARQVQEEIEAVRRDGGDRLTGETVFRLYDTHGLPLELIAEIAEEERLGIDRAGFETALDEQRERSRAATGEGQKRTGALAAALAGDSSTTPFEGYGSTSLDGAEVVRLVRTSGDGEALAATALEAGQSGAAVFDQTVFYAESGGQVGDGGEIRWPGGRARVTDTQKTGTGMILHSVEVVEGSLAVGTAVDLRVDETARAATESNHTATHLLHAALREVLGEGVRQAGSLVSPERLRFDFTYPQPVTRDELREIEDRVNEWIRQATGTEIAERSYAEAVAAGAMALFGEKYGDVVRTVEIPGSSLELCGGCHVTNTGQIGLFLITSERGVASGVRRIEALSGAGALAWQRQRREQLAAVEESLGVPGERAGDEIARLRSQVKEKEAELSKLRLEMVSGGGAQEGAGPQEVEGVRLQVQEVPMMPANELRNLADTLRSKLGEGVLVLGARGDGKVTLLVAVSDGLTKRAHAGKLVKSLAGKVGGGGGGRPDFAQAGGRQPENLPEALESAADLLREQLG